MESKKMTLGEKFALWPAAKKDFFILVAFYVLVLILLTPLDFLRLGSVQFGWAVGGAISIFAFWSISKVPSLLSPGKTPLGLSGKSMLFMTLRTFLYIVALLLSAICTFKPEWFGGWSGISFWGVMAALLPMPFFLIITSINNLKHTQQIIEAVPAEDKKPENEKKDVNK